MKNILFVLCISLLSLTVNAQQWAGSTGTTNLIYRTGNIGIGPETVIPGFASIYLSNGGGNNPNLMFQNSDATANNRIWSVLAQGGRFRILTQADGFGSIQDAFIIHRNGVNITVTSFPNGSVGIGTLTTGTFKLAVEGKIGAREVHVTTASPWPDYVFSPDYKLPRISDVEKFINENRHLPGIPSAQQVKDNGHQLGEMDVSLLKKLEELTLYIIEQNKRLNAQDEKIKMLTEQLSQLQNHK